MSASLASALPSPRRAISSAWIAARTSLSVETRSASRAFCALFSASSIFSRTDMPAPFPLSGAAVRPVDRAAALAY